jgi:alkaline phosphatase D
MAGSITMRSAKIWVQLENLQEDKQYQTYIEYEPIPKSGYLTNPIKNKTSVIEINAKNRNHIWQINDLEPATSYQYKIHIKNLNQHITSKAFTFTTEECYGNGVKVHPI